MSEPRRGDKEALDKKASGWAKEPNGSLHRGYMSDVWVEIKSRPSEGVYKVHFCVGDDRRQIGTRETIEAAKRFADSYALAWSDYVHFDKGKEKIPMLATMRAAAGRT